MSDNRLHVIVLAAGMGTRMKSALPKVMHRVAGLPMIGHVMRTAGSLRAARVSVVVGPGMDDVASVVAKLTPDAHIFIQHDRRGTADAVLAARSALAEEIGGYTVVLYGDTPLISAATIEKLLDELRDGASVAVLGFVPADPTGYGRLITEDDGRLAAIREERDASTTERAIRLCNSGVIGMRSERALSLLERIDNANAKGEFYLTDVVEIACKDGLRAAAVTCSETEVLGVNDRVQLAQAEALFQARAREAAMRAGATLVAPETVWLSYDTVIGQDVVIEPNVVFGPGVRIEDGAEIKAHSHLEGARVGKGARIGPFARLRPGAELGADVHIGNFVEVKNVVMGDGAKANHLAYLGDGSVGAKANIGAGTIFCNYDGFNKHRTEVGQGAFVGSNSALVAPVRIGDGAFIGSGSVITKDVAPNALAIERSEQEERAEWASKFRTMMQRRKEAKARAKQ